jgi:hypothetical protein
MKIYSVTRLPDNAFSSLNDVPTAQDKTYRKQHTCTTGGLKRAMQRIDRELADYSASWGNGAACGAWIETPSGKISRQFAGYLADYKFSNPSELATAMSETNRILDQIHAEWDADDARERAAA